jgi:hypothetical protein
MLAPLPIAPLLAEMTDTLGRLREALFYAEADGTPEEAAAARAAYDETAARFRERIDAATVNLLARLAQP